MRPSSASICLTLSNASCTLSTSTTVAPSSRHTCTLNGFAVFGITTVAVVPSGAGAVAERDRVVAGRDAGDAARQRVGVEVEHHRQRAARLETPGALEQLLLQPHMRRLTDRRGERIVDEQPDGRRHDEVAEPRSVGTDGFDRRRSTGVVITDNSSPRSSASGLGFEHDDRDLPVGLGLVLGESWVPLLLSRPQALACRRRRRRAQRR